MKQEQGVDRYVEHIISLHDVHGGLGRLCGSEYRPWYAPAEKSAASRSQLDQVYPIQPAIHLEFDHGNSAMSDIRPRVLNAVAYARYAVDLLGDQDTGRMESASAIALALANEATHSGIPIDATLTFGAVTASPTAYEDYRHILMHEAQSATPDRPLSRQAKSIVDGQSKVDRCIASGYTPRQCCQALAWEASLQGDMNPNWDYLTNTHSLLSEQSAQVEDGTRAHIQPFNQSAVRAWLSYCGGIISDALKLGDFQGAIWRLRTQYKLGQRDAPHQSRKTSGTPNLSHGPRRWYVGEYCWKVPTTTAVFAKQRPSFVGLENKLSFGSSTDWVSGLITHTFRLAA